MQTTPPRARDERGFSLLELVVTVAILTIIMGAAFELVTRSQASFDRNELLAEAHQNADFAVLRVTELIRGAGTNPNGITAISPSTFLTNTDVDNTNNTHQLRILSDLNADGAATARVESSGSNYYILSSEDVTLKYYDVDTTDHGVAVPGHSLCMIDNTTGTNPDQYVPVILASNVIGFECATGSDPREVMLRITAGPTKPMLMTDPRYASFTRTSQIRIRNR